LVVESSCTLIAAAAATHDLQTCYQTFLRAVVHVGCKYKFTLHRIPNLLRQKTWEMAKYALETFEFLFWGQKLLLLLL
jgi:hypothetical protein